MPDLPRRGFLNALGAAALAHPLVKMPLLDALRPMDERTVAPAQAATRGVTVRAITAGVALERLSDRAAVERALHTLARARKRFEAEGYEVQTTRITLPPRIAALDARQRHAALDDLRAIDAMCVASANTMCGLGPLLVSDRPDAELAPWSAELVRATKSISFSVAIASPEHGIHLHGVKVAGAVMRAVADAIPSGLGSFRFAASANVPAGTPFFPVGWHNGPSDLAIGLESAHLVHAAFLGATDREDARTRLTTSLTTELREVERIASAVSRAEGLRYGGIDSSPAPLGDHSIGAAIEALSGGVFGEAGTLQACALVTDVIKSLPVKLCGYSGLMLPVLEDRVLARRAAEGRYGMRELLLFSSVCGTGLDVVPVPGDTSQTTIERIMLDVAAQATKLKKALSVRLFLVAGEKVGDPVHFDDPRLFDTVVLSAT
jgi:uncharacterized protein (UPF0210 family)